MSLKEHSSIYLGPQAEQTRFKLHLAAHVVKAFFSQEISRPIEHSSKPKVFNIDLSKTDGYNSTDEEVLRDELKKRKLLSRELGYTAFPSFLADATLKTGSYYGPEHDDPNQMWLCLLSEDGQKIEADEYTLVDYLTSSSEDMETSCFAIYDLSHFNQGDSEFHYHFINPKEKLAALRAVVHVRL